MMARGDDDATLDTRDRDGHDGRRAQAGGNEMVEARDPARSSTRDIEEHLRGASDAIVLLLTEVGQLERHKRGIPPGEDRFDEVSGAVRVAAQALAEFTKREEEWARLATADRTDLETIDESENATSLAAILEEWRAVERQLDETPPGTPEGMRLFAEFERLRYEYMAAFRAQEAGRSDQDE
jgi:hypothetical protein